MKVSLQCVAILFVGLALTSGCNTSTDKPSADAGADGAATDAAAGHGHSHEGDDELIWQRADLEHEGYVISLGHRGKQLFAAHDAEPAVMITKDGEPVADAKVFVTLLDSAGETVITGKQATVFEPTTEEEPAHYAQAEVKLPSDGTEVTLRYQIEFPAGAEFTKDVVVQMSKH